MRQGIKRGSQAAIDSRHARVADRPLVLTDDGEQTLPKPGGRTGRMGPKKIPSFNTDTTPRRAKQTASTEIVRGARLALAERVLEAVDNETAETNRRFFAKLPLSAAQKTKKKLVKSAEERGKAFDNIANRNNDSTEDSKQRDEKR